MDFLQDQERNMTTAESVVYAQLTLRAVVWDVFQIEEEETAELDREMKLFHILKVYDGKKEAEADSRTYGGKKEAEADSRTYGGKKEAEADSKAYGGKKEAEADSRAYGGKKEAEADSRAYGGKKEADSREDAGKKDADCGEVYGAVVWKLREAGILEEQALLVTEDGRLSDYVYGLHGKDDKGMAVVYYEKEESRRDVSADMIVQGFEETGIQFLDRIHKRRNRLPWNILYTERTCVREISLSDLDELYALYEGKGITDYTEPLFERSKEEAYTKSYIDCMYYYYGYGMWIIRDRYTGSLIGRAGIGHHEEENGILLELGYIIGTDYQNKGYATEVCRAVIEYAREELGIEELHCFIHRMNKASLHVAGKLGFTQCGSSCEQKDMLHFIKYIHN